MQTFKDEETGRYWQFDADVRVKREAAGYAFYDVAGNRLNAPATLVPSSLPALELEDVRNSVTAQISAWRDSQEAAGVKFEYDGRLYDGGDKSRLRLQDAVASGIGATGQFFWTDEANDDVPMDADGLAGLHGAMMSARVEQGFRIHVRQRQMKEEIAALDVDALQAYQVGWPPLPAAPTDPDQPA